MLLTGAVMGLLLGLALGGRLSALINVRLRFLLLLFLAVAVRYGTQWLIGRDVDVVDALRWPLYALAFGILIGGLWLNRAAPGLVVVMVGVAFNAVAILVNGGWMPVYEPVLATAGLSTADLDPTFHVLLPAELGPEFLRMAGPLGDVIPFPVPPLNNVVSLGDVLISVGLGWFVFATLRWGDPEPEPGGPSLWAGASQPTPARGQRIGERPVVLGGGVGPGLAPPVAVARPEPAPSSWLARVRAHPYVRLARDARFSAFWIGQTMSTFGDRLHQVALSTYVLVETNSAALSGLVIVASLAPNLLLGPIAGTLVDRWDHKRVMVASDLIRAALVLSLPFAVTTDIRLVYPIAFLITTVSLFFRPARAAVLPRIVKEEDLLPANGAMWTGETLADVGGYPLAGILVGVLGANMALAFWLDAATYVVSAALIGTMVIPPVVRALTPRVGSVVRTFMGELVDGWRFLRGSPPLFQNTIVSLMAQLSFGATIALTSFFVLELLGRPAAVDGMIPGQAETVGALEAALGLGNLVGGFVIGAIGARLRKGRLVVIGFVLMGVATIAWGLSGDTPMALVSVFAVGIFNLVWLIPSQTLFGELVPSELMGRVIAMRGALVFGAMTAAAAVSSLVADVVSAGTVFVVLGSVTVLAGVVGALLPAVRDA